MTMISSRTTAIALATIATVGGAALAHRDDPKFNDHRPPYVGPGYQRDRDGATMPAAVGFPASNVTLEAWLPIGDFGSYDNANDCWGYVSPSGREYAIIAFSGATAFVEVTNPGAPVIVDVVSGVVSLWRDVKVFDHYAYSVTEGSGGGIQVIDMDDIDNGNVALVNTVTAGGTTSTHNVAIDEVSGFLYRTGGGDNGLRIYDLNASPTNPPFVGQWTTRYVHDAQIVTYDSGPHAGKQIAFCCSGFNGGSVETGLDILDVTDKSNIIEIGRLVYPSGAYSHQLWLSEDRQLVYLNDELDENGSLLTRTFVIDVSHLATPTLASTFSNSSTAIGHNLYVRGNLIFEANYRSGLRVFDASDPLAPVEVAYFDTWEGDDNANFNGLWSNYPLLPSGTVIGSDIEKGLFVWTVPALRLGFEYPDGVPGAIDPLGDSVRVRISELSPGMLDGVPMLHYDDGDGEETVALADAGGGEWDIVFPATECGQDVQWYVSAPTTDGDDITSPGVGAFSSFSSAGTSVLLTEDMESGAGWSVENVAVDDGGWTRGVPVGGGDRGDPATDYDGSGACWLTDNEDGNSDVDGGPTRLTSPALDATGDPDPYVSYAAWFANDDGDGDRLDVEISSNDGASWTLVESLGDLGGWSVRTLRVADFVTPTASMRLRFSATDNPNDSVTEAAIDDLRIYANECGDPSLPGDVDGSGDVSFDDLLLVLASWGPCPGCAEDVDGDGVVGFADLVIVLSNWS